MNEAVCLAASQYAVELINEVSQPFHQYYHACQPNCLRGLRLSLSIHLCQHLQTRRDVKLEPLEHDSTMAQTASDFARAMAEGGFYRSDPTPSCHD